MENFQNIRLGPDIKWLKKDYILIQAWKKAQQYVRSHNWYADTLELDTSTIRLPFLMKEWSLIEHKNFRPSEIRLVPAPKANTLEYVKNEGWREEDNARLRPLAHVSIREQTLAVACMMCLADIAETRQGKTDQAYDAIRKTGMVSYGNRLHCTWNNDEAHFGWGNMDCYSKFYQDYRRFISRSDYWKKHLINKGKSWIEVQMDLSQFFDRVDTKLLHEKTASLFNMHSKSECSEFFRFFQNLFSWRWDSESIRTIKSCSALEIESSKPLALPQGLVASGFFANIVLLDFDRAITGLVDTKIPQTNWVVYDYCRYVDDMRFILVADKSDQSPPTDQFIQLSDKVLLRNAPGLLVNRDKTSFICSWQTENKLPISRTMEHTQNKISGPMDIQTAWETTETLQGLLDVAATRKKRDDDEIIRLVDLKPDVKNDTIRRFAAHRLKKTLRLVRVLSNDEQASKEISRTDVDAKMDIIARKLVAKFIEDPSNIRLLSIAFDICPNHQVLKTVLDLIKTHLKGSQNIQMTCYYCISEIYRAGATQIGFVHDAEELPRGDHVNIDDFRNSLSVFARDMLKADTLPWYVQQQLLLYLALQDEPVINLKHANIYSSLHVILKSDSIAMPMHSGSDELLNTFALLLLGFRIQGNRAKYGKSLCLLMENLSSPDMRHYYLSTVISECPELSSTIWKYSKGPVRTIASSFIKTSKEKSIQHAISLLDVSNQELNPFRHEVGLLRLVTAILKVWPSLWSSMDMISPSNLILESQDWDAICNPCKDCDLSVSIRKGTTDIRFKQSEWLPDNLRWKKAIGQLMRSAITGMADSSYRFIEPSLKLIERRYYGIKTTWYRRQFGMFMGRSWLGTSDIPISPWITELISILLTWPGQEIRSSFGIHFKTLNEFKKLINERVKILTQTYAKHSLLPIIEFPITSQLQNNRFKIALVQTVLPSPSELEESPEINDQAIRHRQRNHFMTVLKCIDSMFRARKTHTPSILGSQYVDLIVLPELSIHPEDVYSLTKLAINYKCIIFGGLIYHCHSLKKNKLVNEGIWIIPHQQNESWSLDILRQGKQHLAKDEADIIGLEGYRPCQWIVDINRPGCKPFKITASICYDATDIRLAADLRDVSNCYIISALNKNVDLFDNMATALRYHMYQHIIISNSGLYGGSTAQAPFAERHERTIIHSHGEDQISIKFLELPLSSLRSKSCKKYKTPPAGIMKKRNMCYECGKCKVQTRNR